MLPVQNRWRHLPQFWMKNLLLHLVLVVGIVDCVDVQGQLEGFKVLWTNLELVRHLAASNNRIFSDSHKMDR